MDNSSCQLLLSQILFINNSHSFFVSVGLKQQQFTTCILLVKHKKFQWFTLQDWIFLKSQSSIFDQFFTKRNNKVLKIECKFMRIKLSEAQGAKKIVLGHQRISINSDEWDSLKQILDHVTETFRSTSSVEIYAKKYYEAYVEECRRMEVSTLDLNRKLLTEHAHLFDSARFHGEIPILLKDQLKNEFLLSFEIKFID
jgi:hypothetical protein